MQRDVHEYRGRSCKIEMDDEDCSGRYLLWQAMNIRSVGPVLRLAPLAKFDDGQLDFVAAREEDRATLLQYLDARLAGVKPKFQLVTKRFKWKRLQRKSSTLNLHSE